MALDTQSLEMVQTTVVILNWNGAEMLRHYLPSVIANTEARIIVADNGSTDNSLSILASEFPQVEQIPLGKNYGFAEGYNRAIQSVDTPFTVLLNSDVETPNGWLVALETYMNSHPDVAAVQPRILSDRKRRYFEHAGAAGGEIDMLGYPFARGRIMDFVAEDKGQYDTDYTCFWASGACMCVRTELFKECGGLDAEYFAHMEEIDLCWRMQCRGYRIACVGSSRVYHLGGGSLNYGNPRKTYLNFRNSLLTLWKNLPTIHLLYVLPVRCVLDYVAVLNELLHGRGGAAWAIVRARWAVWRMLPLYIRKRKENLKYTTIPYPATIRKRSIVLDYYIKHVQK